MRCDPPHPHPARPLLAAVRAALVVVCMAGTAAWAEPAAEASVATRQAPASNVAGDRIAQFLGEHGLVPSSAAEPSLARQVRDRAADWTSDLVLSAMNFLGVRYHRGGESVDDGFDCSGFTRHVFEASIGLVLPRRANEQAKAKTLEPVNREQLKPGDLVFFNTLRTAFSHVGIYIGDGKFIHAPRTGGEVRVEDMRIAYWSKRFNGARRAVTPDAVADAARPTPTPTPNPAKASAASKTAAAAPAVSASPAPGSEAAAAAATTSSIVY